MLDGPLADLDGHTDGFAISGALIRLAVEPDTGLPFAGFRHLLYTDAQLFDCSGPLQICGAHQNASAIAAKPSSQFGAGRGLARALKPADHDDSGAGISSNQMFVDRAHQFDKSAMNDLHHLFARAKAAEDLFAKCFLAYFITECVDDFQIDVCIQKRGPDFVHGLADIGFSDASLPREAADGTGQAIGERIEHEP